MAASAGRSANSQSRGSGLIAKPARSSKAVTRARPEPVAVDGVMKVTGCGVAADTEQRAPGKAFQGPGKRDSQRRPASQTMRTSKSPAASPAIAPMVG